MDPNLHHRRWQNSICQRDITGVAKENGTLMASPCPTRPKGGYQCNTHLLGRITIVAFLTLVLLQGQVDCRTPSDSRQASQWVSSYSSNSQENYTTEWSSASSSPRRSLVVSQDVLPTSDHNRTLQGRNDRRHQRSTAAYDGTSSKMTNPTNGHRRKLGGYRPRVPPNTSADHKGRFRGSGGSSGGGGSNNSGGITSTEPLRNIVRDSGQAASSHHQRRPLHRHDSGGGGDDEEDQGDDDDDSGTDDNTDDYDDGDDDPVFGFQLPSSASSSHGPGSGVRSVPSMLALANSQSTEPRDKMLKSSKDALIVTKKNYLKKDWCKTEPLIQRVREAGCITMKIVNRFCYGQCNSFYIPKNAKMDIESTAFKSCSFCKPKRYRWITITLHCPGRNPPYKRKRIQRIKKCKCISEILQ